MSHNATFHAKLIDASLLGPHYALLYVRFNSSEPYQSTGWPDQDITAHINSTYPWHNKAPAVVLADAEREKPPLSDWKPTRSPKQGNYIRHLFLLVPVPDGTPATSFEHEFADLRLDNHSSMHVLQQNEVLQWAETRAYSELKSRDTHWKPHLPM